MIVQLKLNTMKKLLLILLCVPLIGFGQENYISNEYFQEESYQYLIADDVNIRLGPSTKTSIVANLPIGSRLKIIEELTSRYTYNNISFPWYKVSFILDKREKIGYVVGGFIAQEYHIEDYTSNHPLYQDIIFLSGISKYYSDGKIKYQIRVAKENKEIDKIEYYPIEVPFDDSRFYVFRNEDISNGIYIIKTNFYQASCAIQKNETTFFFDRNNLYHIKSFSNMDYKTLGFENGRIQINKLIWVDNPENELNGGDYGKKEMIEEYIWDGRRLKRFY